MTPLVLAAALGALSYAAAPAAHAAPHATPHAITYAAPAGDRPAQHLAGATYNAVLPSGRIVTPNGTSAVVGMSALGMTLTPDGRYAIVSNDDERQNRTRSTIEPRAYGGYSLSVVDTATMNIVDVYRAAQDETFWAGIAAVRDPRNPARTLVLASGGPSNVVEAFTLDGTGHLTRETPRYQISTPGPIDPAFGDEGHSYPGTIVTSRDGRRAYVVNEAAGSVSAIDTATRTLTGPAAHVGFFPFGAALAGDRLLVTNEGLMRYGVLAQPQYAPPFQAPAADLVHASSLSSLGFAPNGDLSAAPADAPPFVAPVPMDRGPDGLHTVGGAHPTAIAVSPDARYAYVAMTGVDRIATVELGAAPHVVGGTELRLFDRGPYGTQPSALALSRDGSRLYVALAGLNAVAVVDARDPIHLHRLGLIPTGWMPTALALADDERSLYVLNTKGFGHEAGFTGDPAIDADANAVWSTLEKVDLTALRLPEATRTTLGNTRRLAATPSYPPAITNVVVILEENKTFDAMLGDFGTPVGDPAFTSFGVAVTPNLHALAHRYGVAANLFADAEESDAGHQYFAGGYATLYTERTIFSKNGRRPLVNKNEDPEDWPRLGYIFDQLARRRISYRDYGDLVRVSGYDEGQASDPKTDDPGFAGVDDRTAPTQNLGGVYAENVPAPASLAGHVDLQYPGWNLRIRDERRAREFVRDYSALVRNGQQPRYTYIWLPSDHGGAGRDIPPLPEEVADGDRALGTIVDYLSHLPSWRHTAIFIMPDDAQSSRDHVDEYRSYAVVVSPYAKQHYVGMHHLSTTSVLKTSLALLHAGTLSLGDVLSTDMSDFFTTVPDVRPYLAMPVATQTASAEGRRIAALLERLDQSTPDADGRRAAGLIDLSRRADALAARRYATDPERYRQLQAGWYAAACALLVRAADDAG